MTDAAVKTDALEAKITSLVSVGDRLVQLAAGDRLDDDRDVIGEIATAMTNVRTEVAAISRKLDVVQRETNQHEYERDVARQQAREAEALLKREVADSRIMMLVMAVVCVVVCLATGFAVRWWFAPTPVVFEQRAPVSAPPAPPVAAAPIVGGPVTTPTSGVMPPGATATPQVTGDYACAFDFQRPLGLICPQDVRGVTGQHRATRTVR